MNNPTPRYDAIEREYILNKGWRINADGMLELTAKQASQELYISRSINDPSRRTLMIASEHGSALLFEGTHFVVI